MGMGYQAPGDWSDKGGGSGRHPALWLVAAFLVVLVAVVISFARAIPSRTDPDAFALVIDIPISAAGYGVVHLTTGGNLFDGDLRIESSDGLVLLDDLNEHDLCGPCDWELFAAHPTADQVTVVVELTGWLSDDDLGHEATWFTPDPLPAATAESIDLDYVPVNHPDTVRVEYNRFGETIRSARPDLPRVPMSGVLWIGEPPLFVHELVMGCPPACPGVAHLQTDFLLLTGPVSGTITVLNTGDAAPAPDLAISRPTGWLSESVTGEEWSTSWARVVVQPGNGLDRRLAVPIVEVAGITRGQDPEQVQLVVRQRPSYLPPGDDGAGLIGENEYAFADCDATGRCIAGNFSTWIVPIDWTATVHWAYFDDPVPEAPHSVEIELTR